MFICLVNFFSFLLEKVVELTGLRTNPFSTKKLRSPDTLMVYKLFVRSSRVPIHPVGLLSFNLHMFSYVGPAGRLLFLHQRHRFQFGCHLPVYRVKF